MDDPVASETYRWDSPSHRVSYETLMVDVAQSVRAPGCGPGGRGFKSHRSPFLAIEFPCRVRLAWSRTPAFHAGNTGSNPVRGTFCYVDVGPREVLPRPFYRFSLFRKRQRCRTDGLVGGGRELFPSFQTDVAIGKAPREQGAKRSTEGARRRERAGEMDLWKRNH